jgi:RND superfamily putative drug exporter
MHSLFEAVRAASRGIPGANVSALEVTAGLAYGNVVTPLDLQGAQRYTGALRARLRQRIHVPVYVTGAPAIQYDLTPVLAVDLRRGEAIALPIAVMLLLWVVGFRALLLLPLIAAAATISVSLGLVYLLAHVTLMVSYVPNLVELLGLGLTIDYSLLFVQRFHEEMASPHAVVEHALTRTLSTAGRSVLFSGAAVAIGLSAVIIVPVPFLRSLGIAGVIVPLVSMAGAVTLQPVLLTVVGSRVPSTTEGSPPGAWFWRTLSHGVIRHRMVVLAGSLFIPVALAVPALQLRLTPGSLSGFPASMPSAQGLALARDRVGAGGLTPLEIVLDAGAPGAARSHRVAHSAVNLATAILSDPEVFVERIGDKPPYVDPSGRYRRVEILPRHEFGALATQGLVRRVRDGYLPAARLPRRVSAFTGGAPAQGVDFLERLYGSVPWIVAVVLVTAYLVLLRAFRSLVLPLIALLLDAVSVIVTYGLLVVVFQGGVGARLLGLYAGPQIEGWVPVFLFATIFGLSMDYEVFLVTRMREARDAGATTATAVTSGIERTGRIVTAAAAIMVASFSALAVGRIAGLQELGVGLALGVAIDATLVRMLLLPSAMALLGRWNWWLPAAVARPLRVEASPLASREW